MSKSLIIKDVTIIDGTGSEAKENGTVLIKEGKISSIFYGKQEKEMLLQENTDFNVINGAGKYLLPGLIDSHLHLHGYSKTDQIVVKLWHLTTASAMKMMHGVQNIRLLLEAGFTTVRHCGILPDALDVHLRNAVREELIPGPRILCCGLDLSMTAGHGDLFTPPWALKEPGQTCDGTDECIKAVRNRIRQGVDFIKIHSSGGTMSEGDSPHWRNFREEEIRAICDEAHAFGLKVAAHAHGSLGIKTALRGGVDSIEHGYFMDDEGRELMLEKGAYLIPTLATSAAPVKYGKKIGAPAESLAKGVAKYETAKINFKKAYSYGIKIANGSDCFNLLRVRYNREEFDELAEMGISSLEIIKLATHNAADALGILEKTGTIEIGKEADLILLSDNPLKDITVLGDRTRTKMVIRNGKTLIGG